jgi:DNA-binding transcriptional MerR regulator
MSTPENAPDLNSIAEAEEIPDKLYFRIGEVARLAGIKPYVLRFWETEFSGLGPRKSGAGHRLYRRKDVEMVLEIKRLLYGQRFTIEGARKFLEAKPKPDAAKAAGKVAKTNPVKPPKTQGNLFDGSAEMLATVRKELLEILRLVK